MKLYSRWKELEEQFKLKEEENGKLQDEMDEKENEIEVCNRILRRNVIFGLVNFFFFQPAFYLIANM